MRRIAALVPFLAAAMACSPVPAQAQPTLAEVLAMHTGALGGDAALAAANEFVIDALAGETSIRTFVRRRPFAFRQEIRRSASAEPEVRLCDGRRAFRLGPDGERFLLTGDDARLLIEAALVDGLIYLDGELPGLRRIRGPAQSLAMPPGIPAAARSVVPVWPTAMLHPCGTELRLYFDAEDGRLRGIANTGFAPQRNVRFGDWTDFGTLTLPATRWENRGAGPPVRVRITGVALGPIGAQQFAALLPPPTGQPVDASPLHLIATEVPDTYYPLLPAVGIDRRVQTTAIFDTGAGRTYLDDRLADQLQLSVQSRRRVQAIAGGATTSQRWLEAIELPGWQLVQLEIGAARLPWTIQDAFASWPSVILGGEVRDLGPVLDLRRGMLQLRDTAPASLTGDAIEYVPLVGDPNRDLDEIPIETQGHRLAAVLDTAMPAALRLRPAALRQLGLPADAAAWRTRGALPVRTAGAGGSAVTDFLVRLPSLRIGNTVLAEPWVQIAVEEGSGAADYAAAVGMGAFGSFARVGLDRSRRRLEIDHGATAAGEDGLFHVPAPGSFLGIRVWLPEPPAQAAGDRLPFVVEVSPDSPAATAGLQRGDRLLSIDGTSCALPLPRDWRQRLWARGPVVIEFVRDGGDTRRIELVP